MNKQLYGYKAGVSPVKGVNPTNELTFGICIDGRKDTDAAETITTTLVKDAESLSVSIDNGIEEWNPMDQKGWVRRIMTSKSLGVSMGGIMEILEMIMSPVLPLKMDRTVTHGFQLYSLIRISLLFHVWLILQVLAVTVRQ